MRSFLREYNDMGIQVLTMHEATPGHYLQLAHSNSYPSTLRAVLSSGMFIEGWAVYTEGVMQRPRHRAIRNRSFKLLYEPGGRRDGRKRETPYSLFDLARDPGERFDTLEDLYGSERTERAFAVMREALIRAVAPTEAQPAERVPVDPALRERLEALGYLEE